MVGDEVGDAGVEISSCGTPWALRWDLGSAECD